jgi:CRISPR system Cascade subunit CasA
MKDDAPAFNLVRDVWISCLTLDGHVQDFSLRGVFEHGDSIRRLAGELPTQDYAVLRVLLAVAYRAMPELPAPSGYPDPVGYWRQLYADPRQLRVLAMDYLADWEHRFELFDPQAPFMQVAGLQTASGKTDGVARLIADVPGGHQYFTTRAGAGLASLDFGEAARWLVHVQAYDPSGIKSGAVGDPRVKGGKGYPIGTGWAGNTGGVSFEGDNLTETLLLNLDLRYVAAEDSADDLPVWERPPLGPAVEDRDVVPVPAGPVDVLTWPSRRVRLVARDGAVTRVLVANGDPLAPQNMRLDPMTAYRYSKPQSAKLKKPVFMPRQHDPQRVIWRGIGSLLIQQPAAAADGIREIVEPPIVGWLALLNDHEAVDPRRVFNARLTGAVYGTQSSVVDEIIDDSLPVHLGLLSEKSRAVANAVISAATQTEAAVWALGIFAGDLYEAAGGDPEPPREAARQGAFFALDEPYRRWVSSLTGNEEAEAAREDWNRRARAILRSRARELIGFTGPAAMIGRIKADGTLLTAATAERRLHWNLRRALPLLSETTQARDTEKNREGEHHDQYQPVEPVR